MKISIFAVYHIYLSCSLSTPYESELSAELVQGAGRPYPVRGLLSVTRSALSPSSGGMFLRLLLGSEQLSSTRYVYHTQTTQD